MITLYQMPVSHFCEKIRWTLAYKRLPYKYKNLLPGLHARTAKKLTGQTSVPIIRDGDNVVAHSAAIISYLDEEYPRFPLTPKNTEMKQKALDIEALADDTLGGAVRILVYSVLLPLPEVLIPFFGHDGPWFKNFVLKKKYSLIESVLRNTLPINDSSLEEAESALQKFYVTYKEAFDTKRYLLGDTFTRADIAVASLLAPIFLPVGYGLPIIEPIPREFRQLAEKFECFKPWLDHMYTHR